MQSYENAKRWTKLAGCAFKFVHRAYCKTASYCQVFTNTDSTVAFTCMHIPVWLTSFRSFACSIRRLNWTSFCRYPVMSFATIPRSVEFALYVQESSSGLFSCEDMDVNMRRQRIELESCRNSKDQNCQHEASHRVARPKGSMFQVAT
jgi:hypothetical protein